MGGWSGCDDGADGFWGVSNVALPGDGCSGRESMFIGVGVSPSGSAA